MLSKPKTTPTIAIVENPVGAIAQALNFRTYNTPKILQASMFAIWGLGLLWIPTAIGAIQTQRTAVKTIAKDSVPSVILAQRIIDAMSDMDAMLASELLKEREKGKDQEKAAAKDLLIQEGDHKKLATPEQQAFNKRRYDLAERLTKAASNSTFDGEEAAVRQLMLSAGDYYAYMERAQAAHAKGDRVAMLDQYQRAAKVLDETMIPKAHELRDINNRELEKQYDQSRSTGGTTTAAVFLLGTLTIAALVALQCFLYLRMRRTLNPMLLGATIVALLLLLHAISVLVSTGEELRVLKEDSYSSLLALRLARALLYGANSDESRYLLDPANSAKHEAAFREKTNQAFGQSDNQAVLAQAIKNLEARQPNADKRSYFAQAINNITFAAERPPMIKMMEDYKAYMAIDQQIRDLVAQKRRAEAIVLCLGQSNDAFNAMKKAMDDVKDVNQKVFDDVEKRAMGELAGFEVKATIALGAMATLVFFGLRPRMREYL